MTAPVPQFYEKLPVPSVSGNIGEYTSPELLYSTAGFTQKGVTLAGGQGVVLIGTPLVRGSNKLYYGRGYDGDLPDGVTLEDTARGFMRRSADLGGEGSPNQQGNIVIQGIVKISMLKFEDEAELEALADELNGRFDVARDTFAF